MRPGPDHDRTQDHSAEDRLIGLIRSNERVMRLLREVRSLGLDDWCIAAGTIRNLVWDDLHGHTTPTLPSDIDVLIYDNRRTDPQYEKTLEQRLTGQIPDVRWEVVNQATIHSYTGDAVPYASIAGAMARWADLVTAVAARLHDDDSIEIIAPGGLSDLFDLHVRPNIATPTSAEVYQHRMTTKGWQQRWPKLIIEGIEPSRVRGYLLCASPRSGSTLLCDLLARSGVAGAPESYFRPASVAAYCERWGLDLGGAPWDASYVAAVRDHGKAGTGCFGMRIMWSDMPAFLQRLRTLHPKTGEDNERLLSVFGVEHYVRLSREDKVAQAVSLVIAAQTGLWHRNVDGSERQRAKPANEARYDFDLIATELEMLEAETVGWDAWFMQQGITPMELRYESLAADPAKQARALLRGLGCPTDTVAAVGTAKMATDLNRTWVDRFRSEQQHA